MLGESVLVREEGEGKGGRGCRGTRWAELRFAPPDVGPHEYALTHLESYPPPTAPGSSSSCTSADDGS